MHSNCFSWINKKMYSSTLKDKIITGNLYPETYKLAVLRYNYPDYYEKYTIRNNRKHCCLQNTRIDKIFSG